jgi:uncharacterized membrane protein
MLAAIRPDSWNLPLFLHVLGAILLFGGTGAIAILGFAARRRNAQAALLARLVAQTWFLFVAPAWIVMRVGAQWIVGKEFPDSSPGWVGVGFAVSDGGAVLLLVLGVLAALSVRRGGSGRLALVVPVLASAYVVALGVAWWAMTTKPS